MLLLLFLLLSLSLLSPSFFSSFFADCWLVLVCWRVIGRNRPYSPSLSVCAFWLVQIVCEVWRRPFVRFNWLIVECRFVIGQQRSVPPSVVRLSSCLIVACLNSVLQDSVCFFVRFRLEFSLFDYCRFVFLVDCQDSVSRIPSSLRFFENSPRVLAYLLSSAVFLF